jgi:non-homologous end joining protein Ku
VSEGEYVVVESDELDQIAPGRSQTIDITDFVDLDQIEPVYFDRTYYFEVPPFDRESLISWSEGFDGVSGSFVRSAVAWSA